MCKPFSYTVYGAVRREAAPITKESQDKEDSREEGFTKKVKG
jgi:hypothetical protein